MIYDRLENLGQYRGISRWMDTAITAVQGMDLYAREDGQFAIDGDDVYCMVQSPALKPAAETKWEAHERYIDIQIALVDGEAIGYAPLANIEGWEAYNAEKDARISWSQAEGVVLPMRAGMFAVFFPEDAHRPCVAMGGTQGHKAVVKVRVDK